MKVLIYIFFFTTYSYSAIASDLPKSYLLKLYNESISNLSTKESECSGKTNVLNKDTFKDISITSEELKVILIYKNASAFTNCVNDELLQFYRASTLLRVSYPDPQLKSGDELISFHDLKELESKLEFNNIDVLLRNKVNKISELNTPFNIVTSFEVLSVNR